MVIAAKDSDTTVTGRSNGHPVRCLKNKLMKKFEMLEKQGVSFEELEKLTVGSLSRAVLEGDIDNGSFMSGQSAGMVKKVEPAADIIRSIFEEAEELLSNAGKRWCVK
jgi:enoyl-[acyl-carrier protein] reductase II